MREHQEEVVGRGEVSRAEEGRKSERIALPRLSVPGVFQVPASESQDSYMCIDQ